MIESIVQLTTTQINLEINKVTALLTDFCSRFFTIKHQSMSYRLQSENHEAVRAALNLFIYKIKINNCIVYLGFFCLL